MREYHSSMRSSLLFAVSLLTITSCSGPYSRTNVAADEEKPVPVQTIRTNLQRIPDVITASGELLAEEQATIGVKAPGAWSSFTSISAAW